MFRQLGTFGLHLETCSVAVQILGKEFAVACTGNMEAHEFHHRTGCPIKSVSCSGHYRHSLRVAPSSFVCGMHYILDLRGRQA